MEKTDIQPEKTEVNLNHVENEEMAVDIADQKSAYGEKTFTGEEEGGGKIKKSALERRLVRKLDLIIVPIAGLMYFTAYMDRNSIGLANVQGFSKDLHLTANQYYNCLMMFFVGYTLFAWPGNIGLKYVRPSWMFGCCSLLFGGFLVAMAGSHNYATPLALRILIGSAQAFMQGVGLYVTQWYKRDEIATRSAIYYGCATLSGSFSGLIAYGIQKNLTLEATGKESWRWLFIIEGTLAMFVGALALLLLPNFPEQQRGKKHWLYRQDEIEVAINRLRSYNTVGAKVDLKQMWAAAKDPKCWLFASANSGVALGIASVGLFLPTFVKEFGYSTERTLLFTIIPYACALVVTLTVCYIADRRNSKGPYLIFTLSAASVGYIILMSVTNDSARMFAACLITAFFYPSVILLLSWLGVNIAGFTKRGTTWGGAEIFGQCFSILGTHIYDQPPRFIKGHAILLGFQVYSIFCAAMLMWIMSRENKRRDAVEREYRERGEVHPHASKSLEELQDLHISFRYVI
ncbi:uncharacterized protein PV06_08913 [Exophiala oligosperma]|uniref:Major facilitator superfamily (MFS) profile domain-containing protein n=1 Tax=Exophiala oligosperma TaxID=215243 RepID=A0A0D2BNM5_9EURO|nr:uncharacterized protein PV06_08913 [Exophiala oligosperma]KIW39102.1 hypothetical protein PV06_08913 [Exophiala oligosperma]